MRSNAGFVEMICPSRSRTIIPIGAASRIVRNRSSLSRARPSRRIERYEMHERRDDRGHEPDVRQPHHREHDAEAGEHDVAREALGGEEAAVRERDAAREAQHRREEDVVHEDEEGAGCDARRGGARVVAEEPARRAEIRNRPGRERREREVEDVERLDVGRVALLAATRARAGSRPSARRAPAEAGARPR